MFNPIIVNRIDEYEKKISSLREQIITLESHPRTDDITHTLNNIREECRSICETLDNGRTIIQLEDDHNNRMERRSWGCFVFSIISLLLITMVLLTN